MACIAAIGYHLLYPVARRVVSLNHILSMDQACGFGRSSVSVPFAAKDTFFQVYNYPEGNG